MVKHAPAAHEADDVEGDERARRGADREREEGEEDERDRGRGVGEGGQGHAGVDGACARGGGGRVSVPQGRERLGKGRGNAPDAPREGRIACRTRCAGRDWSSLPATTRENHRCDARLDTRPAETKKARNSKREVERGRRSEWFRHRKHEVVNE